MAVELEKLRSQWQWGIASETRKGLLLGMGYVEEELNRPLVAVVNSWNEYNPGHVHLKDIAERVKAGVRDAGGLPIEVMTTGICDGMVLIDPKYIEVPSRNSIADQVELTVDGNFFDGMVLLSTCDSIVPGHLMGAARLDIPAIMVTGGYMDTQIRRGQVLNSLDSTLGLGAAQSGQIPMEEFEDKVAHCYGQCGACSDMATANSMCMVAEALGMSLPGNTTTPATGPRLRQMAYKAGKQIMFLIENNITARKIITEESVKNAIMMDMAVAGSINLVQHIPAIAQEAGLDKQWWKVFDEASNEVPLLCDTLPSGKYLCQDIDIAGGLPAIMKELLPKLNGDCLTVTGKTLRENVEDAVVYNHEVIRSLDNPASKLPGLVALYGNLAEDGAFVKLAGVPKNLYSFKGKAICFDNLDEAIAALRNNEIQAGDAVVLRYFGLKGRFGTTAFPFQQELKGRTDLFNSCAVITDGRFSGATSGLSVGYVSPEASMGSALALVNNGDEIEIDIASRSIHLDVSEAELAERKKNWHWEYDSSKYPRFLNLFVKNIGSAGKGSIWEV